MARKAVQIRVISRSDIPFHDREEAGRLLAAELSRYRGQNTVVLGIPRGGVVVAREIAKTLGCEMDIILAHKLGVPGHEELAMGAVAETGEVYLNPDIIANLDIDSPAIEQEKERQLAELRRRGALFRRARQKIPLEGKTVIVADDGVATGATTQAAIRAAKAQNPRFLIAAMPVGPEETIKRLAEDTDEMVCLKVPPYFAAVGQFYEQFSALEDEAVLEMLKENQRRGG